MQCNIFIYCPNIYIHHKLVSIGNPITSNKIFNELDIDKASIMTKT